MELKNINDCGNVYKVKVTTVSWEDVFNDLGDFYNRIIDKLLDDENLLYYASQRENTNTLADVRVTIKKLTSSGKIKNIIDKIFRTMGWANHNGDEVVFSTVNEGDLGEYLMCIIVDSLLDIKTVISKVSLKTASGSPAHGNDNVFYDFVNCILYLGEAKFYKEAKRGLSDAIASLKKHLPPVEIDYITTHTGLIISEGRQQVIEKLETTSSFETKSIIFVMNEDIYELSDYDEIIKGHKDISISEMIIVFLPIINKTKFIDHFQERVKEKYE